MRGHLSGCKKKIILCETNCSSSSSSKFISSHTDIVIHIVIYSIILHVQNIFTLKCTCDEGTPAMQWTLFECPPSQVLLCYIFQLSYHLIGCLGIIFSLKIICYTTYVVVLHNTEKEQCMIIIKYHCSLHYYPPTHVICQIELTSHFNVQTKYNLCQGRWFL